LSKLQKEILKRFLQAIDQVCADKQLTAKELCQSIGIHESNYSVYRSGKIISLKTDIVAYFCLKYGYSLNWIAYGTGEMRQDEKTRSIVEEQQHIKEILEKIIVTLLNEVLGVKVTSTVKQKSAIKELIKGFRDKTS
jgi:hypothetical protein